MSKTITVPKTGNTFKGVGYNIKVKPSKNPTLLPSRKVSPKDTGINVVPGQ